MRGATKAAGMAAGAAAVAVQPGGLRKVGAGCLLVLLVLVLLLGGGIAALAWWGSRPPTGLPCPPGVVRVAWGFQEPPRAARKAFTDAVKASDRRVRVVKASEAGVNVLLTWTPGQPLTVGTTEGPVRITAGRRITAAQVRAALAAKGYLPACGAPAAKPLQQPPRTGLAWRWPWQAAPTLAATAAVALAAWWAVGPEVTRLTSRGLRAVWWPVRLCWRRWERFWWRRWTRGVKDEWPAFWPALPSRGQRWAEDPAALRDHRSPRRQDRDGGQEPQRKAAFRAQIARERARDRAQRRKDLAKLRARLRGLWARGNDESAAETPTPAEELEDAK